MLLYVVPISKEQLTNTHQAVAGISANSASNNLAENDADAKTVTVTVTIDSATQTAAAADCAETLTVTVTANAAPTADANNGANENANANANENANANANANVQGNQQSFSGALGGLPPPVVVGGKGFVVNGSDFLNIAAALTRSCDVQHNACANAANSGADFEVSDCETQLAACKAAAQ